MFEEWGLVGIYALSAAVYAVALLNLVTLRYRAVAESFATDNILRIVADGIAYIRTNRLVAGTLMITVLVNFFGFSYGSMVPVIGENKFGLSAFPIGVLMSTEGIGAMLGASVIALSARPSLFPRIYLGGATTFLLMVLGFSVSPTFEVALPLLLIGGVGCWAHPSSL